jgi:GNAT superfamily N-acetyltransferase
LSYNSLKIVTTNEVDAFALIEFFENIKDNEFFHPHPFTTNKAIELLDVEGKDLYYCLVGREKIIAYGFLRGFDDGWDDICLGLIVRESEQGKGYGEMFLRFLHVVAKSLGGLKRVRLHVSPKNTKAISLYRKVGYKFNERMHNEEKIGYFNLCNS